jgi:hypothetical protein
LPRIDPSELDQPLVHHHEFTRGRLGGAHAAVIQQHFQVGARTLRCLGFTCVIDQDPAHHLRGDREKCARF